jgi:hypothetical protein
VTVIWYALSNVPMEKKQVTLRSERKISYQVKLIRRNYLILNSSTYLLDI